MKVSKYIVKELYTNHYGYSTNYITRGKFESVSECAYFIESDLENRRNVGDKFYTITFAEFDTEAFEMKCEIIMNFDFDELRRLSDDIKMCKCAIERLQGELKLKRSQKVIAEWNKKIVERKNDLERLYEKYGDTRNLLERDMKKAKGMR